MVREGKLLYRQQELSLALEYFQKAANIFAQRGDKHNQAITLTNLGRLQLELGKANDALNNWVTAKGIYIGLGDKTGITRSQIYQAHALQKIGFYPRACGILLQTLEISEQNCEGLTEEKLEVILGQNQETIEQPDSLLLTAWRSLGDTLRVIGKLDESRLLLDKIAQIDYSRNKAATLLSLGNTFVALGDLERDRQLAKFSVKYEYQPWRCSRINSILIKEAVDEYKLAESRYQEIIDQFPTTPIAIKAKLNLVKILLIRSKFNSSYNNDTAGLLSKAESLLSEINISNLPQNQTQVYAQINLAKSSACLAQLMSNQPDWVRIAKQLQLAQNKAEKIGDNRAKSYTLGNLGGLYEFYAWWLDQNSNPAKNIKDSLCKTANDCRRKAQRLTEEALYLAQPSKEAFIAYQLQSQLGRLLYKQGKRDDAITAYEAAIKTLESVRDNLLVIDSNVQFSFLENIEPVYRRLLELLLQPQASEDEGNFV
ncbi:MAG: tetratricopeptide repeat protein, partial [Cyanobacteria bacterium J06635_10]